MSLPQIAQQLASKGRNGDTMLVHMSKDEVKGLASLAGANGMQLTINPETGLPEAFKLGKVLQAALPIAAGFALGPAGFGLMSSGMAGLTVGGLYGLATGSVEKGLMAGLGAWGGAGLGGAGAGTASTAQTTGALTGPAATTVATPTAASLTAPLASSSTAIPTALGAQPTVAGLTSAAAPASTLGSIAAPANALTYKAAAPGIGSSIAGFAKANPWTTAALVGGPLLAGMEQDAPAAVPTDKGMIRPYTFASEINRDAFRAPIDGSTAERNYFTSQRYTPLPAYEAAEGGQVPRFEQMQPGGLSTLQGMREGYAPMTTMSGEIPQYSGGGIAGYSSGGISDLGSYSDGGRLLKGPGDGVSDSIPATINNKQPARLADGEFVIPARIVSEIGNGSTDAGARKLYAMMNRVQNKRRKTVGKSKVAVNTKADKDLPA